MFFYFPNIVINCRVCFDLISMKKLDQQKFVVQVQNLTKSKSFFSLGTIFNRSWWNVVSNSMSNKVKRDFCVAADANIELSQWQQWDVWGIKWIHIPDQRTWTTSGYSRGNSISVTCTYFDSNSTFLMPTLSGQGQCVGGDWTWAAPGSAGSRTTCPGGQRLDRKGRAYESYNAVSMISGLTL